MARTQKLFANLGVPRAALLAAVTIACSDGTRATPARAEIATLDGAQACADGDPARQRHGARCLCCHSDEFGVAGSVALEGPPIAHVVVTDATGESSTLSPNSFGNFFRHFPMTPPIRAVAYAPSGEALAMRALSPTPDCNACHFAGGPALPVHGP